MEILEIGKLYWRGEGDTKEGPFCQRCLDVDRKAVRLQYGEQVGQGYNSR